MTTKAGDPGAFARFDLDRVETPAFVVDAAALRRNLAVLADVKRRSGAKVLLALKAFSMWETAGITQAVLDGTCASGLWEARLARKHYPGMVETFCPGFKAQDLPEIAALSDTIVFNTPQQHARFRELLERSGETFDVGLRINPEVSTGEVPKYDPAAPGSRLGFPISQLREEHLSGLSGLHFHTLCEQDFAPLARTWEAIEPRLADWLPRLDWLNMGGGHHISRADYDVDALVRLIEGIRNKYGVSVYLEPGEAVALDAGLLVGEILDIFDNDGLQAIVDISATCHMPDVIEAPYRPALLGETETGTSVRLGGPSCLAGDVIGDYRFAGGVPTPGQRFAFLDQAHYSMVKTTTFNGVPLPSIYLWDSDSDKLERVRSFDWTEFERRLS
ncbi:carboxynorspermidine decarboxylase [Pacificimonas flava]|uniref:Carboxynorspermidine/carboxyspermidine decarboxylase n=2 Tax=Pacificimonas TaxID=1960290 RepID=A0A219B8Y4_9SPHN|nr:MULTISPECIES: carboxynorspermidine decarboxylase [Pacificimonas]MBZ6379898.1 carboxynorspermidine decarboxylase [Pacificimonas aurantium]OWV34797.1 carboxynorspermidine decarboxylase [Pacificimonas flava]